MRTRKTLLLILAFECLEVSYVLSIVQVQSIHSFLFSSLAKGVQPLYVLVNKWSPMTLSAIWLVRKGTAVDPVSYLRRQVTHAWKRERWHASKNNSDKTETPLWPFSSPSVPPPPSQVLTKALFFLANPQNNQISFFSSYGSFLPRPFMD